VIDVARQKGLRVGSAGTHPFSLFERQRITARDRYRNLVDQLQYVARRELIFGMHVHVAVDDAEKAIQIVTGSRRAADAARAVRELSVWRGDPTGLSRRGRWSSPRSRARAAAALQDYNDYAEVVGQLEKTGCIADYTHIWWTSACTEVGHVEIRIATRSRASRTPSRSPPTARRS